MCRTTLATVLFWHFVHMEKLHKIGGLPDVKQWETHLLQLPQGNQKAHAIIWLSIFVVTPCIPGGLHQKFAPMLG